MKILIKYFIQNPRVVNLVLLLIVLVGIFSFTKIRSTSEPLVESRNITISAIYRGASPPEVENGIIDKIEENLEAINGIKKVTSKATEGFALINIKIEDSKDINYVLQDVKDAVEKISTFPGEMEDPVVTKVETLNPTYNFALVGDVSLFELKDYAKSIKDDLLDFGGISTVIINGLPDEELEISVSQAILTKYKISAQEVIEAIQESNIELTGGTLKTESENISIRSKAKNKNANDLQDIIIRAIPGQGFIYLKDIAVVKSKFSDTSNERFLNGKPAISIEILSRNEENFIDNSNHVKEYIRNFNRTHHTIECVPIEDSSIYLRDVLNTMGQNGIMGFLLVLVVLALFLHRRLAFWVAFKIPVVFLGMLILGNFYDLTFNMVSIFGFILVLGILVDDGVVIGENIYQQYNENKRKPLKAALIGTSQMITPVMISLLTTCIAFMLFFFLPGRVGDMFSEMAFVVVGTLVFAMIESFFILPSHISNSLRKKTKSSIIEETFNQSLIRLRDKIYLPVYRLALEKFKWVTLLIFLGLLISSILLIKMNIIKVGFFPTLDDSFLLADLELTPGANEEKTLQRLREIEEKVWKVNDEIKPKEVSHKPIIQNTELILGPNSNEGKLKIVLLESEKRSITSFEISGIIQENIGDIPEAVSFTLGGIKANVLFGKPVFISLYGDDIEQLRSAKEDLKRQLRSRSDLMDIIDTDKTGNTELILTLKPQAYYFGFTHRMVMQQIRVLYFGSIVQNLQRDDEVIKMWLRIEDEEKSTIEQLEDFDIVAPNGETYPLKEIADFEFETGTLVINHHKGKKEIRVEADLSSLNVSAVQVLSDIESNVLPDIIKTYNGITYEIGGQNEETNDLLKTISFIGPIILLLIIALVIFNGKSFSQAFAVFLLFPFALIGVVLGHWIHGVLLNMFSILGLIALLGVFVNNALVFTSTLNENLAQGLSYDQSIFITAKTRFRPIVLTSLTTIVGLAPTIYSKSFATLMIKPPAISIAYGLLFGLILPLFLLPIFLKLMNNLKRKYYELTTGQIHSAEEVEAAVIQLKNFINE